MLQALSKVPNLLKGRTVIDTDTSFSGDIEEIARIGVAKNIMRPASISTNISTNLMRMCVVDATDAELDDEGIGHGIGGYDYLLLQGSNAIGQSYVHEAKLKSTHTGTTKEIAFYKAAIDAISGTITDVFGFDFPDLSGISGTITNKTAINIRDAAATSILRGGFRTGVNNIGTATYTMAVTDSGKVQGVLAGTPVTITLPSSMPGGCSFDFIQTDANQVTFADDGSSLLLNANTHTKTRTQYSSARIATITTGVFVLSGDTAA